jgi:hypothetical protein
MAEQYYSFRPETAPGRLAEYEMHFRRGAPDELVGARLDGGLIRFLTAEEGPRHLRAIWNSALERAEQMRADLAGQVTAQMEKRRAMGIPGDEDSVRKELGAVIERRIETYLSDVSGIVSERKTEIGEPDPDLAIALLKATL